MKKIGSIVSFMFLTCVIFSQGAQTSALRFKYDFVPKTQIAFKQKMFLAQTGTATQRSLLNLGNEEYFKITLTEPILMVPQQNFSTRDKFGMLGGMLFYQGLRQKMKSR